MRCFACRTLLCGFAAAVDLTGGQVLQSLRVDGIEFELRPASRCFVAQPHHLANSISLLPLNPRTYIAWPTSSNPSA